MPAQRVLAKGQAQRIGDVDSVLEGQVGSSRIHRELQIADHESGMSLILDTLIGDAAETGSRRNLDFRCWASCRAWR